MEEKIARLEQEKLNKENGVVSLDSEIKFIEQTRDELTSKRVEHTNNINRQQQEINKSSSKLMECENGLNYVKQEINKIKSAIQQTEKKRGDESELKDDLNQKLNHIQ